MKRVQDLLEKSMNRNINDWRWAMLEIGVQDRRTLWKEITKLEATNPLFKLFMEHDLLEKMLKYAYVLGKELKCGCEVARTEKNHLVAKHAILE